MERIINNPGFEDITRNIFMMLNLKDLANCRMVGRSFNGFLENPMFWLKKWIMRGLSKKNQKDWITAIDETKDTELIKIVLLYFKKMLKKREFIDVPCFIDKRRRSMRSLQGNQKSLEKLYRQAIEDNDMGSLQILVPLMKNPNAIFPTERISGLSSFQKICAGRTPIQIAAYLRRPRILEVIAPLSDNLNNPYPEVDDNGFTPIYFAASQGHVEIVEVLAPLVANLNTDCNLEKLNPFGIAIKNGHLNVVKILAPVVDDLNASRSESLGLSTIGLAAVYGHVEIISFLAQLVDPTKPDIIGLSPIFHAIANRKKEAVKLLVKLSKNLPIPLTKHPWKDGTTPIQFAESGAELGFEGSPEIVAFLKTVYKS